MYRTVFTILLFCYSGPLWACSCGGTLTYAPIVAAPVTTFGRTVETIKTHESVVPKAVEVRTVDKPAIPKSIYPDSATRQSRPALGRLQIFELPMAIRTGQAKEPLESGSETQTVSRPPVPTFDEDPTDEEPPMVETGSEETLPPESDINSDEDEGTESVADFRGQASSQRGEDALKIKPEPPEGQSGASIPGDLTRESSEKKDDSMSTGGPPKNQGQEDRDQDNSTLPGSVSGGAGSMDSQSWTITALVLLSAISTVAFLCTVFVVGEYRKRWLNAIMSQNGMVPNFQGGLYDVPSLSIGYRRYED